MTNERGAPPPVEPHTRPTANVRLIGAGVGGVGILAAIAIALSGPERPPTHPNEAPVERTDAGAASSSPPAVLPAPSTPDASSEAKLPAAAKPASEPPAAAVRGYCPDARAAHTFLVAFEDGHPMKRALDQYRDGRRDDAQRAALRLINRDAAFRGLCLVRFTVGGAELVLAGAEASTAATERDAFVDRLNQVDGVAYAYANIAVQPEAQR